MARPLFPDFLKDATAYRAAQQYWEALIAQCASDAGQHSTMWKRWGDRFANGDRLPEDGNPIYAAKAEAEDRSIRVIQHQTLDAGATIVAWIKDFPPGFDVPTQELVINVELTEDTAKVAADLIRQWSASSVTRASMQELIGRIARPPAE